MVVFHAGFRIKSLAGYACSLSRYAVLVLKQSQEQYPLSPSHTLIPKGIARLPFASKAVSEQIKALDKHRLVRRLGSLPGALLAQVERALKNTLAFS